MAVLKPFKAVRPKDEYASSVGALPYDVMNSEEAREMVKDKPWSFLHVDKAEVDLDPAIDIYDDSVYAKAAENLQKMLDDAYNQGYTDGNKRYDTITCPSYPWIYTTSSSSTTPLNKTDITL
mgnify:CR=1 FL=1